MNSIFAFDPLGSQNKKYRKTVISIPMKRKTRTLHKSDSEILKNNSIRCCKKCKYIGNKVSFLRSKPSPIPHILTQVNFLYRPIACLSHFVIFVGFVIPIVPGKFRTIIKVELVQEFDFTHAMD